MFKRFTHVQWTPKQVERWQATRAKGKRHFVWWRGVVFFGGFMFVFMFLWQYLSSYFVGGGRAPALIISIPIGIVMWPIAGWWWGTMLWNWTEQSYVQYLRSHNLKADSNKDTGDSR